MKKCCSLKFDRCIYRDLTFNSRPLSIEAESIENYEIQISRFVFHAYPSYLHMVSFLTILDIYNNYFKGRLRWCNLMQNDYSLKLWPETICHSSSFSCRSCCVFVPRVVTKEFLDLYCLDELKNFAANIFLKLVC